MATPAKKAATGGAFVPKVLKNITLPVLKLAEEVPVYVQILSEMKVSKAPALSEKAGKSKAADNMEPATTVEVLNLETGENAILIVSAVLKGNLEEHYPGGKYVTRGFAVTKHAKRTGKRYNDYSISEIEV